MIENYVLQPSNCFAYKAIYGNVPEMKVGAEQHVFDEKKYSSQEHIFLGRLEAMDSRYRPFVLQMYANPIVSKCEFASYATYADSLQQQTEALKS